jgi:farnesyl-diphosphate farnesyltransferase
MPDLRRDFTYCVRILPHVSRTFALNIKVLSGLQYKAVLISYLICRIVDTVEDSVSLEINDKIELLEDFKNILKLPQTSYELVRTWIIKTSDATLHFYEADLLKNADKVLHILNSFPKDIKNIIIQSVIRMINGMKFFINKYNETVPAHLVTFSELDKYCYYVAGTVGELLTSLFTRHIRSNVSLGIMERFKLDFGLALQLTNIIKDLDTDQNRGWIYTPYDLFIKNNISYDSLNSKNNSEQVYILQKDMTIHTLPFIKHAILYINAIPRKYFRYRLFCLIPAVLSYETIKHLILRTDGRGKISRIRVKFSILMCFCICMSNNLIQAYTRNIENKITDRLN